MEKFIQEIVKEAGDATWKLFGKTGVSYIKSEHAADAVTKADLLSEKILIARIKKVYPNHGIISEESASYNSTADYVWIMDPLDGTLNFATTVPLYGVMVCLTRKGIPILASIYLPATKELLYAKKGKGAFLNGKKIHCSKNKVWEKSLGLTSSGTRSKGLKFLKLFFAEAEGKHFMVNSLGCMAVSGAYVAIGRRDWFASFNGLVWDYAPTGLILKEAGCVVTNAQGKPWQLSDKELVVANPYLHKELLKITKKI